MSRVSECHNLRKMLQSLELREFNVDISFTRESDTCQAQDIIQ